MAGSNPCWVKIYHGGTIQTFDFPYEYAMQIYPETISDRVTAEWAASKILNATSPIYSWSGTSARTVSFNFDVHIDSFTKIAKTSNVRGLGVQELEYFNGVKNIKNEENKNAVLLFNDFVRTIRSAVYPEFPDDNGSILYVPIVEFKFGDFRAKGILESFNVTWKKPIIEQKYSIASFQVSIFDTGNVQTGSDSTMAYNASVLRHYSPLNPFGRSN